MGSKTFNYPKSNSAQTSSQAGHSSRVASRKSQNLKQEQTDDGRVRKSP